MKTYKTIKNYLTRRTYPGRMTENTILCVSELLEDDLKLG